MKFSSKGYYGNAIYFAKNASYSNNGYCHKLPSGERQLFLAEVLLGEYPFIPDPEGEKKRKPNSALKMPPTNPANNKMFDSVKGYSLGSDIFMVYQSNKAYPRYLVTYTA